MQLPRGTFREIKKSVAIRTILEELEQEKFSGICTISSRSINGTLVFRQGKYSLAKIMGRYGNEGLETLIEILDEPVDAALDTLDETQIQLALEFNKQALVRPQTPPTAVDRRKPVHQVTRGGSPGPQNAPSRPHARSPPPAAPVQARQTHSAPQQRSPVVQKRTPRVADPADLDQELESIDTIDLDNVTEKLKGDCRTMIKKLDLEHLLER